MNNKIYLAIFLLFLIPFLAGCTTSTEVARETTTTTITTTTTTNTSTSSSTSTSTTTTSSSTSTSSTTTTTTTTILTYSISGTVKFASTSDPVKNGVAISISGPETKVVTSDASTGNYSISDLPAGTYTLEAAKAGWNTSTETISLGSNTTLDFSLWPTSWEVITSSTIGTTNLNDVASIENGSNPLIGKLYVVGDSGKIYSSSDGGTSWIEINSPTSESIVSVVDGGTCVLIANQIGGIFSTIEANPSSSSWKYEGAVTNETISAWRAYGPASWNMVTSSGKLLKTSDGGTSYADITPPGKTVKDVCTYGFAIGAACASGTIKISSDEGSSWQDLNITPETTNDLLGIFFRLGNNSAITVSAGGEIYVTQDFTTSLPKRELDGIPYPLRGCYTIGSLSGSMVVGENGLILRRK